MANMKKHLNKKKPCKPIKQNIKFSEIEEKYFSPLNKFPCKHCGKCYSHQSSQSRHEKDCISSKKVDVDSLQEQLNKAFLEIEALKKNNSSKTTNNTINCSVFNTTHTTINAYGSEKFQPSYESLEKLLSLNAHRVITKLINDNHFNIHKPENMNFYISNYKDNIGRIFDGQFWEMKDAEDLVDEVFSKYRDTIDEMIELLQYDSDTEADVNNIKNILSEKLHKHVQNWQRDTQKTHFDDGMKEKLKQHIYSKKELVTKTHKLHSKP